MSMCTEMEYIYIHKTCLPNKNHLIDFATYVDFYLFLSDIFFFLPIEYIDCCILSKKISGKIVYMYSTLPIYIPNRWNNKHVFICILSDLPFTLSLVKEYINKSFSRFANWMVYS